MSDEEHSGGEEGPSEAELALKKRREQKASHGSHGLNDEEKELLETNRKDRDRMDEEIRELRARNEKRKKEREVEEKRLTAQKAADDEKRKAAEEEKKKQKEEEQLKKQKERAKKMAEFKKWESADKPNFVISKRSGSGGDEETEAKESGKKSREQLDAEKKAILKQRIVPLQTDGMNSSGLSDKAKELHKLIYRLEGEKYDLEKRFKNQQIDMTELADRARQANKVGKGGLKRLKLEGDSDVMQERFAGTPAKVEMFSQYERQTDARSYKDRKTVYTGPQYILPSDRIKATKIVKWSEEGLPSYEDVPEGAPEPAAAPAAGEE